MLFTLICYKLLFKSICIYLCLIISGGELLNTNEINFKYDMDEDFDYDTNQSEEILKPIEIGDLMFFIAFIIGILSDLMIMYCILRYKKMKTKANLCILNWSIASCFTLATQIRSYKLISHAFGLIVYSKLLCYTLEYQTIFHAGCSLFMMLLSVDYVFDKCTMKQLNLTFVLIWSVIIGIIVFSTTLCANGIHVPYSAIILMFTFFLFLVCVLMKCRTYKTTISVTEKVRLCLCTCFLIYWLLLWITFAANIIFYTNVLKNIHIILILLIYVYPLINFILLISIDKNYKLCLLQLLRCTNQYVEATICYKEDGNNGQQTLDDTDINDENSSIDIVMSSNNERL